MPNLHEIIKQIQKDLFCPVCGSNYEIGELKVRGLLDHTLIVQTECVNGHMTFFMTTLRGNKNNLEPVSANDVISLHNILKRFNGDFESIWKK